jgi:hypothetical protein
MPVIVMLPYVYVITPCWNVNESRAYGYHRITHAHETTIWVRGICTIYNEDSEKRKARIDPSPPSAPPRGKISKKSKSLNSDLRVLNLAPAYGFLFGSMAAEVLLTLPLFL